MKIFFLAVTVFCHTLQASEISFLKVCQALQTSPTTSFSSDTIHTFTVLRSLSEKTDCQHIWEDLLEQDDLNLQSKGLKNLQLLRGLQPTYLSLEENNITSLWGLENMLSLKVLSLEKNKIQDISPLSQLNLYALNVAQNPLSTEGLFAISEMPFLLDLDFSGTDLEDDPLETMLLRSRILENRHQNKPILKTPDTPNERLQQLSMASRLWNFPQIRHDISHITDHDWIDLQDEDQEIQNRIKATWLAHRIVSLLREKFISQTQQSPLPAYLKESLVTGLQAQTTLLEKILSHKISNINLSGTDIDSLLNQIDKNHPYPMATYILSQSISDIVYACLKK